MAVYQNSMGLNIIDPRSIDERYAAATSDTEKQRIVAERDAENAAIAKANDDWHKAHGTGVYAANGVGGGNVSSTQTWEEARLAESRSNTLTALRGIMESYGLTALMSEITSWVQGGADEGAVMARIRTTDSYKQRFPAMAALTAKNRGISEAAYIEFERKAASLERQYGLPAGMLGTNQVTTLLTNEVDANELEDRVTLAAAAALDSNPTVRDTFKNYYGIDQGGLTAYFLDSTVAEPLLKKQYAASAIGAEAALSGLGIEQQLAEQAVDAGISRETARVGFGKAAGQRSLTSGRGDIVGQDQLAKASIGLGSAEDAAAIERAAGGRLGQFQGGGEFLQTQKGNIGLGSAATR